MCVDVENGSVSLVSMYSMSRSLEEPMVFNRLLRPQGKRGQLQKREEDQIYSSKSSPKIPLLANP